MNEYYFQIDDFFNEHKGPTRDNNFFMYKSKL